MAIPDPKALTRDQLASFLPNQEIIRRFERLFQQAGTLTPDQIETLTRLVQEASIDAGIADAKASAAADSLKQIAQALEIMASRPEHEESKTAKIDYIDFNRVAPHSEKVGRLVWDVPEDTLNLHHTGGVTQQVGQEQYAYIPFNAGPNLFNGQCVGFNPGPNTHIPFIADGSLNSLFIIGVATQDIPNAGSGRVTVWGRVRNFDTTGTPYGEAWLPGQLLYVSPVVAGGFTNVKPTAPNLSIPIAQVRIVNAVTGEVFVRPTAEQRLFYGAFSKLADQTPAVINTAYAITWTNTEVANGVSIGAPSSRIVAANSGLYKFSVSIQLTSGSASVKNVWIWFRKNGVDVPNSSVITSLDSATAIRAPSRSLFFSLAAGDYIEVMFASDSTAMTIDNIPATAFAPASPAAILTVNQEQQ